MTRKNINVGTTANDGTGDTLRTVGQKINDNFIEIFNWIGDSNSLNSQIFLEDSAIAFEGSSTDDFETRLAVVNPTADRVILLPDAGGTIVLTSATQTLTNKTLTAPNISAPTITAPTINDANSNELIKFTSIASAVNEITVSNNSVGNPVIVSATGGDTNINLRLDAKGSGSVRLNKVAFSSTEITANGATSANTSYIICNKATALAVTLANGTTIGESKIFTNKGVGIATITPASFAQGTTFALDQYDSATLVWDGTNWYVSGHYGATIA